MRHLPTAARILMGLAFFASGLAGLLNLMPKSSTPPPEAAMALFVAMMKTGYMFKLVKGTELAVGLLLLSNRFVPLALTVIAPVLVNIIAFHGFLFPAGIGPGAVLLVLELYLAWAYRDAFRPMLAARVSPARRAAGGEGMQQSPQAAT